MIKGKVVRMVLVVATVFLLVSGTVLTGTSLIEGSEEVEDLDKTVLVNTDAVEKLNEFGDVLDSYGNYVLLRTDHIGINELSREYDIDELEDNNVISVKGHTFDTSQGLPEIDSELKIDGYESGEEGIYIVDMIGPVNPDWRVEIEKVGADVINYQPNYAYEVVMTPEQAEKVEDKFFVDWVGVYQPEFKLHSEINTALEKDMSFNVRMRPGFETTRLNRLEYEFNSIVDGELEVLAGEDLHGDGYRVTVDVDSERVLEDLAMDEDVYYISPHVEPELHAEMDIQQVGGGQWFMDDEYETRDDVTPLPREGDPQEPYRKHGDYGAYINQIGYSGEEVTVAVADTGIGDGTVGDAGHEDFTGRVIGGYGFGLDEDNWADGHYHGTACTGLVAGDTHRGTGETMPIGGNEHYYMGQGLAYESEIFGTKIFDDGGGFMPEEYYPIVEEPAQRSDAYVHSNSWGAGTMGSYSLADEAFDQSVRDADRDAPYNREMVITTSAGNDGPGARGGGYGTVGSPANSKNVITVGGNQPYYPPAHDNPELMFGSSSRGWTEDNRIKPDVIAPSESINTQDTPLSIRAREYVEASGTSFGNPIVAGAAAVVVEWYEENYGEKPSPAMVRSILINTANELDPEVGDTESHVPNRDEGWGVPDISKLEYPKEDPIDFLFEDQETVLTTGEEAEYMVTPSEDDQPLKITLVWTDQHALAGDSEGGTPTLKNNLNLEVETPAGEIIRGNAFDLSGDGWSDDGYTYPEAEVMEPFDHNDDGWDDVNNVQNVYIPEDEVDDSVYRVRIKGTDVPEDALNTGEASQDFAFAAYNAQEQIPKDAELNLDREEYSGDDTVKITLADHDLKEEGTYDINVTSVDADGNEIDEEWITLAEDDSLLGHFEGIIETTEDPDEDGALYVEHDGEITAWYHDEDPGGHEESGSTDSVESNEDETLTSSRGEIINDEGYLSRDGIEHISTKSQEVTSDYEEPEISEPYSLEDYKSSDTPTESLNESINLEDEYEIRDPIEINNNTDFHDQADEDDWPGDGSEDDPYIIKGYEIDGELEEHAVYIEDTDLHFELRDNYLYHGYSNGIHLSNVENAIIIENEVFNNSYSGIYLTDGACDNLIVNNTVENHDSGGIDLWDTKDNVVESNTVKGNDGNGGIVTFNTENTLIRENIVTEQAELATRGIWVYDSYGVIVEENHVFDNPTTGVGATYGSEVIFDDNLVENNEGRGFLFPQVTSPTISNNTILNNEWHGIYAFADAIYGMIENNYFAGNVHGSSGGTIQIHEPGWIIRGNTITDNYADGIRFTFGGDNNEVKYNTISNNEGCGIYINNKNEHVIYRNKLFENEEGNAHDPSGLNDWHMGDPADDGQGGNYWGDYLGEDRGDGIGDEPYVTPPFPPGVNEDHYPWVYDVPGRFENDIGVLDIFPSGAAPNETIEVEAFIANLGQHYEEDITVNYEIGREDDNETETWSDTIDVDMEPEEFKWVTIGEWTPPEEADEKDFYHNVTTDFEYDQNPDNTYLNESFEVRDIHDVGFTDITHPKENQPYVEEVDSTREWMHPFGQRADSDGASGWSGGGDWTWYAGMKLSVEDYQEEYFTDVTYYDYEDGGDWAEAKIATVEYVNGQPVVDEFVGQSDKYETDGHGWVELELEDAVEIEDEEYWVLMHVHDDGDNQQIGVVDRYVEDAGWYTFADGDPTDPNDWVTLEERGMMPRSWLIEAQITDYTWPPEYEDTIFNETQPVEGVVENFGNKHETDVSVEVEIICDESEEVEYSDENTVDELERGETVVAKFEDWDPSSTGYYTINMTTDLENDEGPTNDYHEVTIYVEETNIDLEATSIEKPEEPIFQYYENEVVGRITNLGNYRTNTPVEMMIEKVNEEILIDENFSEGLPEDWSIVDEDGSGHTWEFDEEDEAMKVASEVENQSDILWTHNVDATEATHRFMVEFYSEFDGNVSRDLLISTDGGETSQRVKTNISEGEVSYDLIDWVTGEDEVMIGWEFFSEQAEEGEYWLIDDVEVIGEDLEDPEYVEEETSEELYPRRETQVGFENWLPDEEDLPSDYIFTMETLHEDDENLENTVITERMFVDYNLPPYEPENPSPYGGEDGVSHQPEFSVYVSDPNEVDLDVTFYLLDDTGVELRNSTVEGIESGTRASYIFSDYLEPDTTYQWYVEVEDIEEMTTSDTWTFHTYEPEPEWKTASAGINAMPPKPVENLTVDWDADVWEAESNILTWDASPDDGAGENDTEYYVVYRADSPDGPWNETTEIDIVIADGLEEYTYVDEGKASDGVQWHYVVRGVDRVDNIDMNEDYVAEKPLPDATDPNPEDNEEVEELEQTISVDVTSPTGEPLEVEFYHGEKLELIAEYDGITDERVETDYPELTEEDRGQHHYWFVKVSYEDYNVGKIVPEDVLPGPIEEEWHWLYEEEHRYPSDNAVGLNDPGDYYGAIRLDLSDDVGGVITDVAYYDYEDEGDWAYAYVAEDDDGAPSEWLASSEEYNPEGAGWVELALDEPVPIEEPGEYWIVMHMDDKGDDHYPLGCTDPYMEDGGFINIEDDPFDPGEWDILDDLGFDETWSIEAMVAPEPEPEGWSFYLKDTVDPEYYELTIDSAEGGEVIEPGEGDFEYEESTVVDLEAEADEGWEFVEWTGDIEEIEDPESAETTIEMLDDYEITAEFAIETYELTISSTEGGEVVQPDEDTYEYEHGEVVILEAVADENYEFKEWTGDIGTIGSPSSRLTTIEMLDDYEITANFEEVVERHQLTVDIIGEGQVEIYPDQDEYDEGTEVTLTAEPDEGWEFVEWTRDYEGTEEEIVVTMNTDKQITAVFEEELEPAYFEIEIKDYDDEVEEGETVTIEFTVENPGELEDTQTIVFSVDDNEEDSIEVTLDAGEEYSGEFEWEAEDEGDYDLEVASEDTSYLVMVTVEGVEEDEWWEIPGFTIPLSLLGAVIAVAIYHKKERWNN